MTEEISITIDGTKQTELLFDLLEVIVDTNLFMPSMFSLLIHDDENPEGSGKMKYIDSAIFKVGAVVKITMKTDDIPDEKSFVKEDLIEGEITALEPIFSADGTAMLRVRGYDKSHRLTRGKKTRTFEKMKDSAIIQKIVQEAGLSCQVDTTTITYDYVMQYNQTDWDFIWSRAQRIGYQVYYHNGKLNFKKMDSVISGSNPAKLTWGYNLRRFEPRLSAIGQVNETIASGWDPVEKKEIIGKKSGDVKIVPEIGMGQNVGGDATKKAFGSPAINYLADTPVFNASEAELIATGEKSRTESTFIQAEGECAYGDPRLIAGKKVVVDGIGNRFGGKYYVTEAQHHYSRGTYTVYFGVSGQTPNTIHALLNNGGGNHSNRIDGVVTAVVTKNSGDPNDLSRIQVKFPWLPKDNGAELSSAWARIATPGGGKDRGFLFFPEINDEVLVAFEHGDINYPLIVGGLWNKKDLPPLKNTDAVKSGEVNQRVLKSRSGHQIMLDDTKGAEKISIQDKSTKNIIEFDVDKKSITFKAEGDLIFEAGGKFTVTSKGDLSMASKAKASFESQSAMSMESKQKTSVKVGSNELALQMAGSSLKGTQVEINGSAKTDLKGGAMVQIQGGIVKIN
jgi:phage protein D/phage baseplate assembly protein gpV